VLKISYAGCLGLSPAISAQFALRMCFAVRNCDKNYRNPLFSGFKVVQGHRCWYLYEDIVKTRREGGVGGKLPRAPWTFENPAVAQKYKVRQNAPFKNFFKFLPRGAPSKMFGGPARMFPLAPLWLSTGPISSQAFVMISSMSVLICNRFYVIRANGGKIRTFQGYPFFTLPFEGNFLTQRHEFLSQKN